MKRTITITLALILSASLINAQTKAWEKTFAGSVNWQRVTSLGFLLVNTNDGLYGIDTETGNVLWKNDALAGIPESSYSPIPKSPFVKITLAGDPKQVIVLDPVEGKQLFNSKDEGIVEIKNDYVLLRNTSIIIVGVKEGNKAPSMICVDMSNGKVAWTKDDEYGMLTAIKELNGDDFIATTLMFMYRINSKTGDIVWKGPLDNSNPFAANAQIAGYVQNLGEAMLKPGDIIVELMHNEEEKAIYGAVQTREEKQSPSDENSTIVTYKNTYLKFDETNGDILWKQPLTMKGKKGSVQFTEWGMMIFPKDDSNTKINLIETTTGAGKWGKKGNGTKVKGSVIDHRITDRGVLVVTGKTDNAFLNMVNIQTGELMFKKYEKIKGLIEYVEITPSGLLYLSEDEANILDMSTGENKWNKSIKKDAGVYVNDGNIAYIFSSKDKAVYAIDKSSGIFETLGTEVALEGKENAKSMEMYNGDVLVISEQNMISFTSAGTKEYHTYHAAPREPGLKRALLYAQAVRAAYIGGVSKMAAGAYGAAAEEQDDAVSQAMVEGISEAYDQIGDAGMDYAKKAMAAANARFKASARSQDFIFMMTQLDSKEHALLQVSKDDGSVQGQVNMGKDKEPSYEVDAVTNKVYYRESSGKIASYQF